MVPADVATSYDAIPGTSQSQDVFLAGLPTLGAGLPFWAEVLRSSATYCPSPRVRPIPNCKPYCVSTAPDGAPSGTSSRREQARRADWPVAKLVPGAKLEIKAGIYKVEPDCNDIGLACDHARLACRNIKTRYDIPYAFYNEDIHSKLQMQQFVLDNIDGAVENEHIKVFYQPVVRVRTGEICGFEALVRWVDPNLGVLPPADFISTLEQFHMIHKLDIYVAECVCRRYTEVRSEGRPLVPVSINLSRLDFELCDIFGIIESIREKYDVPRNMIDIEITESVLHNDSGHIRSECEKMRDLGYQIWLDDFGSGYSSLNSLVEYSFDVLKLDMLFLRSFDKNPKAGILMTKIVEGARDMGLKCLCEGVESEEHWNLLKKIGCEKAQGYYFGKPLPYEEARQTALAKGMVWES